jgi:hypothetical protein
MWVSPSKIPINTSFTSSGNVTKALSDEDKRVIPLVERAEYNTKLEVKNTMTGKSIDLCYVHSISTMFGLSLQIYKYLHIIDI